MATSGDFEMAIDTPMLTQGVTTLFHEEFEIPDTASGLKLVFAGAPVGDQGLCFLCQGGTPSGEILIDLGQ
jgi:hypothetical protein